MLCRYKDVFGLPNQGVHSYRLFGFAVVDVSATILAAVVLSYYTQWNLGLTVLGMFLLGIVAHKLFCVETALNKLLL
jgi:hypothetical protein